jgi:hypothetical protein
MEMVTDEYRGYVMTYHRIPMGAARWIVNLSSEDRPLNSKLQRGNEVIIDHHSLEGAIRQAKIRVDGILGSP